ncbi:hypothetical protein PVK06_000845 [Gossypium arboreum]|uniref:Uncharacterized protein n=1 Tax=Gossypium arboreum TaxID=29729 RepID=A0ABR0QZH8_GOSAR|nr:hypothetical protein PVK06_000845 [Gossypium arboreum]
MFGKHLRRAHLVQALKKKWFLPEKELRNGKSRLSRLLTSRDHCETVEVELLASWNRSKEKELGEE